MPVQFSLLHNAKVKVEEMRSDGWRQWWWRNQENDDRKHLFTPESPCDN